MILTGDDYAYRKGPMMSPKLFERFFYPEKEDGRRRKEERGPLREAFRWQCVDLLHFFIKCGVDGIHSIEPQAEMNITRIKEKYGSTVCVMGNIDTSYTLPFGKSRRKFLKK